VEVPPSPSIYIKFPQASLAHSSHSPILSFLAWLPRLELCPRARGNSFHRMLSRCWISSLNSSYSATSLDRSLNDIYITDVCNCELEKRLERNATPIGGDRLTYIYATYRCLGNQGTYQSTTDTNQEIKAGKIPSYLYKTCTLTSPLQSMRR
jgi:hypothetical protein